MTISGWLMLAIVFAGLYWMGLKLNPPSEHQTIVPEPNNLLRSEDE